MYQGKRPANIYVWNKPIQIAVTGGEPIEFFWETNSKYKQYDPFKP